MWAPLEPLPFSVAAWEMQTLQEGKRSADSVKLGSWGGWWEPAQGSGGHPHTFGPMSLNPWVLAWLWAHTWWRERGRDCTWLKVSAVPGRPGAPAQARPCCARSARGRGRELVGHMV